MLDNPTGFLTSHLALVIGLAVALGGALILAGGSQLQSDAVFRNDGQWRRFVLSPRWLLGLALLGLAIATNFLALALAPISAVQSMSVAALAASALYGVYSGTVRPTACLAVSVTACLVGIGGFVVVIGMNPGWAQLGESELLDVLIIQASAGLCGLLALFFVRNGSALASVGLLAVGAVGFGAVTAVFKVLTSMVVANGPSVLMATPLPGVAAASIALGGLVSVVILQRSHEHLPAPTVVAGLTAVDTITAAVVGTFVLRETDLSAAAAALLVGFGVLAITGVFGLRKLRRTGKPPGSPTGKPTTKSTAKSIPTPIQQKDNDHARSVLR